MAPEVAHAGPLNCHLAGGEANLALGSAPAMTAPAIAAGMASPASLLGVLFHHGPERLDPGRQTEPIKADRNGVPSFVHSPHSCQRQSGQWCDNFLHGVAFLSWNQHPEPTGSRRATPLFLFQHLPGQSRLQSSRRTPSSRILLSSDRSATIFFSSCFSSWRSHFTPRTTLGNWL